MSILTFLAISLAGNLFTGSPVSALPTDSALIEPVTSLFVDNAEAIYTADSRGFHSTVITPDVKNCELPKTPSWNVKLPYLLGDEEIQFQGTCGAAYPGFCDVLMPWDPAGGDYTVSVTLGDDQLLIGIEMVPTLSPSGDFPIECSGSGCPSTTHDITGWSAIREIGDCFLEVGGGN